MRPFQELLRDLVYGLRMLRKSPGFTAVVILSLALGIGANTAIFSLIDSVILKLLPVRDPRQLTALTDPANGGVSIGTSTGERQILSNREFESLRARCPVFSGMFAVQSEMSRNSGSLNGGAIEEVHTRLVSGDYFTVLGASPLIGRAFAPSDEKGPGSAPYAVASYEYWQRRFGGSSSVLDTRVRIGNAHLSIVGVMRPAFYGENVGEVPDLWIPLAMQPEIMPGRQWLADDPGHIAEKVMWLQVIGRRKPGVSLAEAQANVDVVFKQIVAEEFSQLSRSRPEILKQNLKLHDAANGVSYLRGNFGNPLLILMGVAGLVLAIACANVANLLLARAAARQKEMAVRLALGASRARIVRQFLTESLALAALGGIAGSLLAVYGVALLIHLVDDSAILDLRPDLRMLAFTVGVCLLTGFLFGLAPAWRSSRSSAGGALKEAGRGLTAGAARIGLGKILVIGQIALSTVLLVGAGWFIRTLRNLENVDLGYSREKLVLVGADLLTAGYDGDRLPIAYEELRRRLAQIPGVRSVTYSGNGLFSGSESGDRVSVEGYHPQKRGDDSSRFDRVGPHYFAGVGIPILLGRDIEERDTASAESVCVVNETFAKFYFGDANPIGKHVTDEFPDTRKTFTIVGVARDARDHSLRRKIDRRFYLSALQPLGRYTPRVIYEMRASAIAASVIEAARKQILAFNPAIPQGRARTMDAILDDNMRQERLIAQLSTALGGLALLLACIGLYGVLSYNVARRTNEIGIRMALGAGRASLIGMILGETAALIGIGLACGIPASLACARFVESRLFGLKAADPLTLAAALAILSFVAVAAGYVPAHRASRVDPLVALRDE